MEIQVGKRYYHKVYEANVDIMRVYRNTVTIRIFNELRNKFFTYRGENKKHLAPKKSYQELYGA